MTLRQYNIDDLHVKGIPWNTDDAPREPGQLVCHVNDSKTHGMVVAVKDGYATVLWSKAPIMVFFDPIDFAPRKGIMTRYSGSLVNASWYGTIKVLDLMSGSK